MLARGRIVGRGGFHLPLIVPAGHLRRIADHLLEIAVDDRGMLGVGLAMAVFSALPVMGTKITGSNARGASCRRSS